MVTGYLGCFSSVTMTTSSVAATTSRQCAVHCSGFAFMALGGGRCRCMQTYADSADAAPAGGADGSCGADLCEGEEGLLPPPVLTPDMNFTSVKRTNNSVAHSGVMAIWQGRAAYAD